jgi:opacity protein-like surface antigen
MKNRIVKTVLLAASLALAQQASAIDVLGFYVGAGAGRADLKGEVPNSSTISGFSVDAEDTAWKAIVGVRPISLLGAEVEYIDLGSPSETSGRLNVQADLKATAVFGLLYLPIPAPFIDIFGKAGYARVEGDVTASLVPGTACPAVVPALPGCAGPIRADLDDNVFAAGAGAQFKFASWAIRAEYERFMFSGDDPSLISLSLTKTFF